LCNLAAHAFGVSAEELLSQRFEAQVEKRNELPDSLDCRRFGDGIERRNHREVFKSGQRFEYGS
jgi:hypothetical protein